MVHQRLPSSAVDVTILQDKLHFRNGKQAKNRFMKPPMTERICTWDLDVSKRGLPTERIINMYEKWGQGGFGLIFSGNVSVDPYNLEGAGNAIICKENDSAELRQLLSRWAKAVKSDGSLVVMQISHAGRMTPITIHKTPYSASDVQVMWKKRGTGFGKPTPFSLEQIQTEVIDRFVFAAKVAHESGFDGVQVHTAHGCLLSQFLSPSTNLRTDQYGGSVENRARVVLEIMDTIRKEIPKKDFLMGVKINSADFEESEFDDTKTICQLIEEKEVDFVELTGGSMEKGDESQHSDSTKQREALFQRFANNIRPIFKDSVIYSTGGFRTAAGMVSAVRNGETHGVGIGRPTTAEPDFPKKILSGEITSAVDSKLNAAEDFFLTIIGSQAQMALMGRRSLAEINNNDICSDIPDFSDPLEADNFKNAVAVYGKQMDACAENDEPVVGTLEYIPL